MFWDRELPGFGVRVHPSGRKVYVAQTRARGKAAKRVTVGVHGVLTAEEARRRAALIIARIKAGEEPVAEPMAVKLAEGPTVAEIAERYLEEHVAVRCKPKTVSMYRLVSRRNTSSPGFRQASGAGGRAQGGDRTASCAEWEADHGEPCGGHAVPDLQRGRGSGADPGGKQSLPAGGQVSGSASASGS